MDNEATLKELFGLKIESITGCKVGSDSILIKLSDGPCRMAMELYHSQDCCEEVLVIEVHGDPADMKGLVVLAEESVSSDGEGLVDDGETHDSTTWTFYRLITENGNSLVIRWLGESNGYYSESVNCRWVDIKE